MRSPLGIAHTLTVLSALTVASLVLPGKRITFQPSQQLWLCCQIAPVGREAAAVDAAAVLGGLVLIQFSNFIAGFAVKNEALHIVAHAHKEVAAGGKSDTNCHGTGLHCRRPTHGY
jgi:hypothetical protein